MLSLPFEVTIKILNYLPVEGILDFSRTSAENRLFILDAIFVLDSEDYGQQNELKRKLVLMILANYSYYKSLLPALENLSQYLTRNDTSSWGNAEINLHRHLLLAKMNNLELAIDDKFFEAIIENCFYRETNDFYLQTIIGIISPQQAEYLYYKLTNVTPYTERLVKKIAFLLNFRLINKQIHFHLIKPFVKENKKLVNQIQNRQLTEKNNYPLLVLLLKNAVKIIRPEINRSLCSRPIQEIFNNLGKLQIVDGLYLLKQLKWKLDYYRELEAVCLDCLAKKIDILPLYSYRPLYEIFYGNALKKEAKALQVLGFILNAIPKLGLHLLDLDFVNKDLLGYAALVLPLLQLITEQKRQEILEKLHESLKKEQDNSLIIDSLKTLTVIAKKVPELHLNIFDIFYQQFFDSKKAETQKAALLGIHAIVNSLDLEVLQPILNLDITEKHKEISNEIGLIYIETLKKMDCELALKKLAKIKNFLSYFPFNKKSILDAFNNIIPYLDPQLYPAIISCLNPEDIYSSRYPQITKLLIKSAQNGVIKKIIKEWVTEYPQEVQTLLKIDALLIFLEKYKLPDYKLFLPLLTTSQQTAYRVAHIIERHYLHLTDFSLDRQTEVYLLKTIDDLLSQPNPDCFIIRQFSVFLPKITNNAFLKELYDKIIPIYEAKKRNINHLKLLDRILITLMVRLKEPTKFDFLFNYLKLEGGGHHNSLRLINSFILKASFSDCQKLQLGLGHCMANGIISLPYYIDNLNYLLSSTKLDYARIFLPPNSCFFLPLPLPPIAQFKFHLEVQLSALGDEISTWIVTHLPDKLNAAYNWDDLSTPEENICRLLSQFLPTITSLPIGKQIRAFLGKLATTSNNNPARLAIELLLIIPDRYIKEFINLRFFILGKLAHLIHDKKCAVPLVIERLAKKTIESTNIIDELRQYKPEILEKLIAMLPNFEDDLCQKITMSLNKLVSNIKEQNSEDAVEKILLNYFKKVTQGNRYLCLKLCQKIAVSLLPGKNYPYQSPLNDFLLKCSEDDCFLQKFISHSPKDSCLPLQQRLLSSLNSTSLNVMPLLEQLIKKGKFTLTPLVIINEKTLPAYNKLQSSLKRYYDKMSDYEKR